MGYWENIKKDLTLKQFSEEYKGSMECACDHGCNQWLKANQSKVYLILRFIDSEVDLNKITKMHVDRADKIFFWLSRKDSIKFNKQLREGKI